MDSVKQTHGCLGNGAGNGEPFTLMLARPRALCQKRDVTRIIALNLSLPSFGWKTFLNWFAALNAYLDDGHVKGLRDFEGEKAVIYLRVSTAAQAERDGDPEGYSIPAQREACVQRVRELGWEIAGEFIDAGESAKSADRPQLRAMLTRVADGDIAGVIVHKIDRLARNIEDHVAIKGILRTHDCQLVSVTENIEESASGKLVEGIHALMAEFYSSNLATEIRKGSVQKAKSGGTPYLAPLGYLNMRKQVEGKDIRTVAVDPDRAPLVQYAFEAFASGQFTLNALQVELARKGLTSRPYGKRPALPLSRAQLSNLLHNRYYIGIVTYAGVEYAGRHEPLVDRDLFDKVQSVLKAHHVSGEKKRKHPQYLKGSVFCGRCGSRLCITRARGRGGIYMYFFCNGRHKGKGCRQPYVLVDRLEEAVIDYYGTIQLDATRVVQIQRDVRDEMAEQRRRGLREAKRQAHRLAELSAQRTKLLQVHYADAIPLDLFKLEQQRITQEIAEAERILAARQMPLLKSRAPCRRLWPSPQTCSGPTGRPEVGCAGCSTRPCLRSSWWRETPSGGPT
jgi:site-specific DNA recombinase